jgi:hypothetical protein
MRNGSGCGAIEWKTEKSKLNGDATNENPKREKVNLDSLLRFLLLLFSYDEHHRDVTPVTFPLSHLEHLQGGLPQLPHFVVKGRTTPKEAKVHRAQNHQPQLPL